MEFKVEKDNENGRVRIKLIEDFIETATATCFFKNTPKVEGKPIGTIGEMKMDNKEVGIELLKKCEEIFKEEGISKVVAPMNGNTWKQYRTLKNSSGEPNFLMENVSPKEFNEIFEEAGFSETGTYTSTKGEISKYYNDEVLDEIEQMIEREGIKIRHLNKEKGVEDLREIYNVSVQSFARNPFYTPISEKDYMEQYTNYLDKVDEELILIAEKDGKEVGFLFAIPNLIEMQTKGKINTLILKTIAVLPEYEDLGLGNVMTRRIAKLAIDKGYRDWIFAFMYKDNTSQKLAKRNGTSIIREYALYGKDL